MSNDTHRYAMCIVAQHKTKVAVVCYPAIITAQDNEEACQIGLEHCRKVYPDTEGWEKH